jgi:hypothetical protein
MSSYEIEEVVKFLKNWRTRKQLMEEFNMSNTSSYHCLSWLTKAYKTRMQRKKLVVEGHQNNCWFYIIK